MELTTKQQSRFDAKYNVEHHSGCWMWTGATGLDGYGIIQVDYKFYRAHRLSHLINIGDIPKGMLVCHLCDTPSCVNPHHLFLGTPQSNTADRNRKLRTARGIRHGNAKLTEQQVLKIRAMYQSGKYQVKYISEKFNCGQSTIRHIISRENWKHI